MRKDRAGRSCALRANYIAVAVAAAFAPWSVYGQTPPPNQMPSVALTRGDAVVNPATGTYQQIDQASLRAIYEGSMTMGSNAHLHLNHAVFGRSGLGLFKDVSGSLSQIFGRITSNGQVFISNPNGVLFGSTARVDVGGLFATSLSTNDDQFMAGGARIQWTNSGGAGTVTNQGEIITAGGYAALAGPQVRNDGIIRAQAGSVVLAAGDRVNLDLIGDGLISVSVDQAAMNASAINAGTIEADGGTVLLTVRSAGTLLDTVINAGGVIRATSLIERNGEIVLDGGSVGTVMVAGNHNAGSSSVRGANVTMRGTIVTDLGSGTQSVSTPGTLSIEGVGGSASNSGFIHQGSGEQRVEAGNLFLQGGTGVGVNAVITSSAVNADQRITVSGNLQVKGGAAGDGNQAIIRSAGNQVIDGNPNITVEGGASSGPAGNNTAFIVGATSNQAGKKQTINASSITVRSGAGGFQNGAVILGPRQEITTTGDVLLAGGSTGGTLGGVRMGGLSTGAGGVANTATDLKLDVGNDLLMRGGAVASNSANIGSTTGQPQTVSITAARDVVVNDSITSVSRIGTVASTLPTNGTPGSISVSAGRDIKVNGGGEIVTTGTVTLTAANGAIKVDAGSPAAGGARVQSGEGQDIQAQSVSVTATNGRSAQLINQGIGTQSVKAGTVEVRTVAPIGGLAEIRNNSAGDQTVTVTGDKLDIKALGGGTATIFGGGNQTIDMTRVGSKTLTLGDNAAQGQSTIVNNGEQKILGYADLKMTGGSGPVANGSNAIIQSNSATATQRIEANSLEMSNSTLGGNSSVAAILAARQNIHALGNVTMTANASGGTLPGVRIGGLGGGGGTPSATNLTLTVGGDLILAGSNTTANNGVGIGSTGAVGAPPVANNITIDAGGNVKLNAGSFESSGVRIGTSANTGTGTGPGEIRIKAGGSIELNGSAQTAAIRTQGNVTLEAASISEGSNGIIVADTLTTTTTGVTNLAGPNEITRFNGTSGGVLTLVDAGGLQVTGISTTNDAITLTTDNLANIGVISNGGGTSTANIILNADAFNLAGGTVEGGAAAVVLRPRTGTNSFGIESAGTTTLTNADIASINTSNFIVFGSGIGTTFTGNMTIGEHARVEGGAKNLAFFRGTAPGLTTIGSQGVATTGDVIVSAGLGAINSNGGTVRGDEVQLRAGNGIGSALAPVRTAANALAMNNSSSAGVFVSELDNVTLRTISLNVGGMLNTFSNGTAGVLDFGAAGAVNVAGIVSSGPMTLTAGGSLTLDGAVQDAALLSGGGQTITAQSISLTALNGRRATIENTNGNQVITATAGDMNLQAPSGVGVAQIVNTGTGNQTVEASGQINVLGGATGTSTSSGIFKNGPSGLQTVRAAGITLQGASTGFNAGAGIRSQSDQLIDVSGDIHLRGGNGGNLNNAFISASATGQQTVFAHDINMSNGVGGIDTSATITAGHQLIDITGNLTMTSQAALLGTAAGGPGVRIGAPGGSIIGTDLRLLVDGNITLNGGTAVENGAAIGSSGAGTPAQNTLHIEAGGNVVLNAGTLSNTGVRIGSGQSGTAGGNISIQAGGSIELNGSARSAAIRTLGDVTLEAASITEGSNGFILANTLTTTTTGATNLAGPNDIVRFNGTSGGPLTLVDAGGLQVTGISTTNDTITLTTDSLTNTGLISNGGGTSTANIVFNADSFNLAAGTVEGGAAAVVLRPRTGTNSFGIESAGQTTLTNADIASIHTSDFVVFGSGIGTTFTGNMTIGENARVEGGGKNLAFFRSSVPGGTTTIGSVGVNTAGNLIVSAGGGAIVSNGGTVSGDQVQLRASQGIGSAAARVQTAASRLALNNTGPQGAFVFEAGDVTLGDVNLTVGGNVNNVANVIGGGGAYDVTAGGSIAVADRLQAGSVSLSAHGGAITETGAGAIVTGSLSTFSSGSTLLGGANQVANFSASSAGDVALNNTGALTVTGLSAGGNATLDNVGNVTVSGPWSAGGTSHITAHSDIALGSVLTSATVALEADGSITEFGTGAVVANTLTTVSGGSTLLGGANQVANFNATSGNDVTLNNTGALTVTGLNAGGNATLDNVGNVTITGPWTAGGSSHITAHSDIVLGSVLTSNDAVLQADGTITEFGTNGVGAVVANTLTTVSGGSTFFSGQNRVANYSGTSGADLFFFNLRELNVTGLSASLASLSNNGAVTISGPWITTGATNITAFGGPAATLSETAGGFIQAAGFNSLSADGGVSLNGLNRISGTLFGSSMQGGDFGLTNAGNLNFGAFARDVNLINAGVLEVTSLSGRNLAVTNAGPMTISGFWNSTGTTSITTAGPASDLTVKTMVGSQGRMTVDVDGVLTVTASGSQVIPPPTPDFPPLSIPQFASLSSSGGQDITAKSVLVSAQDGARAEIINSGSGNQSITVSGGRLDINSAGATQSGRSASSAQISNFTAGSQTIDVSGGALTVAASGQQVAPPPPPGFPPALSAPNSALLGSSGGQNITARSVRVSAQDGGAALISNQGIGNQTLTVTGGGLEVRSSGVAPVSPGTGSAQIGNFASGSQTIRVSGGSGIDVQANGGTAIINHGGAGLGQSILVTDADHINLNGLSGNALITTNGGAQTVSITGNGANAIILGSAGNRGFSQIANGSMQNVTAGGDGERGSITITGGAANGPTASIVSRTSADGAQTVSTSGLLRVVGGTAPSQPNAAGIFHNGSGEQKVSAARIELEGGASGNNNAAIIAASGGGVPANAGAQTINVSGDIVIAGGAGGNAGISGPVTRLQKIRAHNIDMTNSALGGNNSVGFILGGHQDIHATGNVTMTARASGGDLPGVRIGGQSANAAIGFPGTGTDLKLVVDGNLTLNGSTTAANNGVGIGTSAAVGTPAFDNKITVEAGGNVILNAGTFEGSGVRIGTSTNTGTGTGGGDIRITAGGNISLNGTAQAAAIRTRGDVTLEAATIAEAGRGLIEASELTTRSSGDTQLGGPNSVNSFTASSDHGNVQLTNTSAVLSLGSMDLPGDLTVVQTGGDLAVGSASVQDATLVAAAGNISLSAAGHQILVRGSDTTIGAASAVLAGGDLRFSAGDVTLRAGDAALTPVVVRGANGVQMTVGNELKVTAGGFLSPALLTSGRDIDLTIGQALRIDAGSGFLSLARVQTEVRDGVIRLTFPNLSEGGYFVNGLEGDNHQGQTGFFTDFKPAKVGTTLLLDYGN